jgi:hypothetical protein
VRPAIATVVGPRWENQLVEQARSTGLVRLVGRCCDESSLEAVAHNADVVFVGSEVHWIPSADLHRLAATTRIVGIAADEPGAELLFRAGIDEVIDAETPIAGMLAMVLDSRPDEPGRLIEVTGPRGAPGRSEVALALAYAGQCALTTLIEADAAAPSLGLRMALPPNRHRVGHEIHGVTLEPAPVGTQPQSVTDLLRHIEATRLRNAYTIVDTGPDSTMHRVTDVDESVVVGEATDIGVVRLARLCDAWTGPTPRLVINRHVPGQDLRHVRRATGLEPSAVIPITTMPSRGSLPPPRLRSALRSVVAQRTAL